MAMLLSGVLEVEAQQVYKVGSTPTSVPFCFLNTKTNEIEGVMVDTIRAIGENAGFKVEIVATDWKSLIPALQSSKIDLIAAAMYNTPERAKAILFSDTVVSYGEALVLPQSDTKSYGDIASLKGLRLGVVVGASYLGTLAAAGITDVKSYDTNADLLRDISLGRLDGGLVDKPLAAYLIAHNTSYKLRLAEEYKPVATGNVAIATRLGNAELIEKVNAGLKKAHADGTIAKILAKWDIR
ncbi:ABC transporter substrate-binding protein [Paracoccus sp. (in: a-proteobacteria)]|uniref:substrate-binding periplasmic protein n=1 Tax=Paracoccus sp. TaxID=267 RepID=UPI003220547B